MPDLNLNLDYFEHPKTVKTISVLGPGSDVLPIKLWKYCGKFHAIDGKLVGYSPESLETICGWWGEKGKMLKVFLQVGWIHEIEGGYEIHDWLEHQGHLEAFSRRGKAANKARWSKIDPSRIPKGSKTESLRDPPYQPTSTQTKDSRFPVEPPPGMPESEEAAGHESEKAGVPRARGIAYWTDLVSQGWVDGYGKPVPSFGWHVKSRYNHEKNKNAQRSNGFSKPMKPEADLPTVRAPI